MSHLTWVLAIEYSKSQVLLSSFPFPISFQRDSDKPIHMPWPERFTSSTLFVYRVLRLLLLSRSFLAAALRPCCSHSLDTPILCFPSYSFLKVPFSSFSSRRPWLTYSLCFANARYPCTHLMSAAVHVRSHMELWVLGRQN